MKETTIHGFRLRQVQEKPGSVWLFLPGGAGLGSEYFSTLMTVIDLPGSIYLVDFPGDGSNPTPLEPEKWKEGLIEVVKSFKNVYLVAHSFAAMFVMTCPELENYLTGLVLMSASAKRFTHHVQGPVVVRDYFLSRLHLYVSSSMVERAKQLFKDLPYNDAAFLWVKDHFHPHYTPTWVPERIPTLVFTGELDQITPLTSFDGTPYQGRPNIRFVSIKGASHFPWLEKPEEVVYTLRSIICK